MRARSNGLLLALLFAFLTAGGYWYYHNRLEWRAVDVDVPQSPQARLHPMLAASLYLQHFDYPSRFIESQEFFFDLPGNGNTIITRELPDDLLPAHYRNLYSWIENGGHLITGLRFQYESEAARAFLDQTGISIESENTGLGEYHYLSMLSLAGNEPIETELFLNHQFTLPVHTDVLLSSGIGNQLAFAQFGIGNGIVTATVDSEMWDREYIDDDDNARLLIEVIAQHSDGNSEIYIHDSELQLAGVFSLLWTNLKWLCLLLLTLGLARMRQLWVRFGPVTQLADHRQNNFARHLLAVSRFRTRHTGLVDQLVDIRAHLLRRFGATATPESAQHKSEILTKANHISGVDSKQLGLALFTDKLDRRSVVSVTRSLQAMMLATKSGSNQHE